MGLHEYKSSLLDKYSSIPILGLKSYRGLSHIFPFADVYIPPRLYELGEISETPSGLNKIFLLEKRHRNNTDKIWHHIKSNRVICILGDPGCGKTTLSNQLARESLHRSYLKFLRYIPFCVRATDFADADVTSKAGNRLVAYFIEQLSQLYLLADAEKIVLRAFNRGKALVIIDGIDEVLDERKKEALICAIEECVQIVGSDRNRFVLTSRKIGYQPIEAIRNQTQELYIDSFEPEDVTTYIIRIRRSLCKWRTQTDYQSTLKNQLLSNLSSLRKEMYINEHIRTLATNPFLLSNLCGLREDEVERTTEILEKILYSILISNKEVHDFQKQKPYFILEPKAQEILSSVAYQIFDNKYFHGEIDRSTYRKSIQSSFKYVGLSDLMQSDIAIQIVSKLFDGIIIERGSAVYAFPHKLIFEYLVAKHIAGNSNLRELWIESYLNYFETSETSEIATLLPQLIWETEVNHEYISDIFRNLTTTKNINTISRIESILNHIDPKSLTESTRVFLTDWVSGISFSDQSQVQHQNQIGVLLGAIGDLRVEIMDIPFIPFVKLPTNILNSTCQYFTGISLYTITNKQFDFFISSGGYDDAKYWTEAGWRWLCSVGGRRSLLAPEFLRSNQPVVGVSWFEAYAYCSWLTSLARSNGWISSQMKIRLPTDSEWETAAVLHENINQKIYIKSLQCIKELQEEDTYEGYTNTVNEIENTKILEKYINSKEKGIGHPLTVGLLPEAQTAYGLHDCYGNVWEWLVTAWGDSWEKEQTSFVDSLTKNSPNHGANVLRMVKGGSFADSIEGAHFDRYYRTRSRPDGRYTNHGFRIACVRNEEE